ncbi:MAG: sugar phosphate nucleotidyltransferase [Patescibacteria group bacterium]
MQVVILAAGESSRFWPLNQKHKSQIRLLGRPLIYWTIKGLAENGIKNIAIIISPGSSLEEDLKPISQELDLNFSFIVQEKPLSTGNAIFLAKDFIKEPFFIVWGAEVLTGEIVGKILEKDHSRAVLVGAETDTPWDYGIFKLEGLPAGRQGEKILEIVENPKQGQEPSKIKKVGIYFLEPSFFDYYQKISKHHEADFIEALNLYLKDKKTELLLWPEDVLSLKYPWDLFPILEYLSKDVKDKIYIGKNCQISPNCHLRGPVSIGDNCKIGNGVEIKNSIIGDGTRIPHLSYIGDSIIGENCNLGAGTITANLRFDKKTIKSKVKDKLLDTGREKFGCVIGNNTQAGINVSLMPGILIGSNCQIGPASLVRENIEDNTTFYSEFKSAKKSA